MMMIHCNNNKNQKERKVPSIMHHHHQNFKFTIKYSRNCDGGMQEMATAAQCVREIFPESEISIQRTTTVPIWVTITATNTDDNKEIVVWSGKQQLLFEKYANKRTKTMARIKTNLRKLVSKPTSSSTSIETSSSSLPSSSAVITCRREASSEQSPADVVDSDIENVTNHNVSPSPAATTASRRTSISV